MCSLKTILTLIIIAISFQAFPQNIGINEDGSNPDASAILDIKSNNKGLLTPRLTTAQRTGIAAPATGLIVFDTTTNGFWYYDGAIWVPIASGTIAGNTLDGAYDEGGAGAGRIITADGGVVSVQGTDGIEVTGTFGSGATIGSPGTGTRMVFNPRKAAFRAGHVPSTEWDDANVGDYSVAMGDNVEASGDYSVAMGRATEATGIYDAAIGFGAHATGTYSTAIGWANSASGPYSLALGGDADATGFGSVAIGRQLTSSGSYSFAAGYATLASGDQSTSMGNSTTASGLYSFSSGNYTNAEAQNVSVFGRYNVGGGNVTNWVNTDPLFEIGNGADASNLHNAFTILKNGNTGLATATPSATLDVVGTFQLVDGNEAAGRVLTSDANGNATWAIPVTGGNTLDGAYDQGGAGAGRIIDADAGVVSVQGTDGFEVTGTYNSGAAVTTSGAGARMFYNPNKAAFRAGSAYSNEWDDTNVGEYSIALGRDVLASGSNTVSIGTGNIVSTDYGMALGTELEATGLLGAFALGHNCVADDFYSMVLGYNSTSSAWYSTAIGYDANASGWYSIALGGETTSGADYGLAGPGGTVEGDYGFAIGNSSVSSGNNAVAIGSGTTASGISSFASNSGSIASGDYSFAGGNDCIAAGLSSFAIGNNTESNGRYSASLNNQTIAQALSSTAIGRFNVGTGNSDSWVATDPIFEIGIGSSTALKANAVTVLKNGNTGIMNPAPDATLDVIGSFQLVDGSETAGHVLTSDANGNASWVAPAGGGNTLDGAYDQGGAGAGRIIDADAGSVSVQGGDGFEVIGEYFSGATIASSGSGSRMFFNPRKAAFRAGSVIGTNWNNALVGDFSIAMGNNPRATGANSVAIGAATNASTTHSVAIGYLAESTQTYAMAVGRSAVANGSSSSAFGHNATAGGSSATAIGYNSTSSGTRSTALGYAADAGADYSIALGGTTVAGANYSLAGPGGTVEGAYGFAMGNNSLASGNRTVAIGFNVTASGTGAFAFGTDGLSSASYAVTMGLDNTADDEYTFALGRENSATAQYAVAMGYSSEASGDYAFAAGSNGFASGSASVSMGSNAQAQGNNSVAMGSNTLSSGSRSVAMGFNSDATASYAVAIGNGNLASGTGSAAFNSGSIASNTSSVAFAGGESSGTRAFAVGEFVTASGTNSFAAGNTSSAVGGSSFALGQNTTSDGLYSAALNYYTTSRAMASTAIGRFNIGSGNLATWVATDPIFEIGIGSDAANKANAVTVLKNGNTGVMNPTPDATLDVVGNFQLVDGTEGANRVLTSDANGNASWEGPVAFSAYLNTGTGIISGADFAVTTIEFTSNCTFNLATSTFTAPVDGVYSFTVTDFSAASLSSVQGIRINVGLTPARQFTWLVENTSLESHSFNCLLELSAGDIVAFNGTGSRTLSGSASGSGVRCSIEGHLVR